MAVVRTRTGAVEALTVTRTGNAPIMLERVVTWKPTLVELSRLSGDYSSAEIDGPQKIEIANAALAWRDPSGAVHRLVPIYRDAFEAPDASWTLRFSRGVRGVMMLDMSITRERRVSFQRTRR